MKVNKNFISTIVAVFALVSTASASVFAQDVTRGYLTDKNLQNGMIVRITEEDKNKVDPLPSDKITDMLGVVVSAGDSAVSISTVGESPQVFVATYGRYNVLVSDQNGAIQQGDFITISAVAGVGMRADSGQSIIIGKAADSFDGKSNTDGSMTIKSSSGDRQVGLKRIMVDVSVSRNPSFAPNDNGVPTFLAKAAKIVTSNPVAPFRLYAALVVMVISIFVAGGLLFAGVRSSMIAIGRNPLAKKSIIRGLIQVIIVSIIVFVIGLIAVYLLLKV